MFSLYLSIYLSFIINIGCGAPVLPPGGPAPGHGRTGSLTCEKFHRSWHFVWYVIIRRHWKWNPWSGSGLCPHNREKSRCKVILTHLLLTKRLYGRESCLICWKSEDCWGSGLCSNNLPKVLWKVKTLFDTPFLDKKVVWKGILSNSL